MAQDDTVKREMWEGKIPVCFRVADEELNTFSVTGERTVPEPCYMMIPRVSYFPLVYEKLNKLYAKVTSRGAEDELWLSAEATPLKWHYPVGVLYDLYGRGGDLPWEITVHFKDFPEDAILHCQGREAVEAHFKSKLKEADCVKHRSGITQSLTPEEFGQLWKGFSENNYEEFWAVNKKMMLNTRSEPEPFKNIPFCVYQDGKSLFQRLFAPIKTKASPDKDSAENTLEDLVQLYSASFEMPQEHCVLIQGIEIPLRTPLQWLSENLSYPDNFLHICVVHK